MSPEEGSHLSGYAVVKVYSTDQELRHKSADGDASNHDALKFGWDWRWVAGRLFEVRITVSVEPSKTRSDYVSVNAIGRFRQVDGTPSISIEQFVRVQAVAILLPYARQYITALTSNAFSGAYYLPTLNVYELMRPFDPSKATGMRQIETRAIPHVRQLPSKTGRGSSAKKK